jgi:hypothetical protein
MAHNVFFTIPEKELLSGDIRIRVYRDVTQRKNISEDEREKGKLGELLISQGGIEWFKRGAHKKGANRSKRGIEKSWRDFANWIEK